MGNQLADHPRPAPTSNPDNLRRLLQFRFALLGGECGLLVLGSLGLGLALPLLPLGLLLGGSATLGLLSWARLRWQAAAITAWELFGQFLLDVAQLFGFLYFLGGATNPFVFMLLLPPVLAAATLPERLTWALTALATLAYSLLLVVYRPAAFVAPEGMAAFSLHVWGMWIGFLITVLLAVHFLVRMGNTLRHHERQLARERENALRDEQLVSLGTLAAGTAHELATPLGTMLLLSQELEEECADRPAVLDTVRELQSQVTRCRSALGTLSESAGQPRAEGGGAWRLDQYLQQIVDDWRSSRPGVQGSLVLPEGSAPELVADRALTQALINILDNAADASPEAVTIRAAWDPEVLWLDVCDRGPGISAEVQKQAGQDPLPAGPPSQGLGLGLFLSHAVLRRLGGEVTLYNRPGGGACTRLTLPLPAMQPEDRHAPAHHA